MKRMMRIVLLALLLTGCAGEKGIIDRDGYQLDTRHPAQAAYPRIKVLVIHYTADNFDVSLATLTDKEVSSHYLIPEQPPRYQHKPRIWQLVPEEDLARHAGVSYWRGSTRINDTSIGIELENRGWQKTAGVKSFTPFHPEQIAALIPLARDIIARYHIAPQNVVAHADIAPQRKRRSGAVIPPATAGAAGGSAPGLTSSGWPFYLNGRPASEPVDPEIVLDLLSRYGYQVTSEMTPAQKKRVIIAFQMHFRPQRWDGVADAQTEAIAEALLEKIWPRVSGVVYRGREAGGGGAHDAVVKRHHRLIAQLVLRAGDIERKIKVKLGDAVVGKRGFFGGFIAKALHAAGDNIQHRIGN